MSLSQIAAAVGGVVSPGDDQVLVDTVTIDSRVVAGAGLFVALQGTQVDGHDYVAGFLAAGGVAALVERAVDGPYVLVENATRALGDLARYYRTFFKLPVIGVTGSVGKTSTCGMIGAALSTIGAVGRTQGNLNNDLGVPLTILRLDDQHRYAVVEMGMDHFGEMRYLTGIVRPTIAVITGIGTAHIGNIGSQDGIFQAKMEILEGLGPDAVVVVNGDDRYLRPLRGQLGFRTVLYGLDNAQCDFKARDVQLGATESSFYVRLEGADHRFVIPAPGAHHIYNALAAIAVGVECGVPVDCLQRGVMSFESGAMRQNIALVGGVRVIEDCYNASPSSMEAALDVLALSAGGGRTIAVLGDMYELGDLTESAHRGVGDYAAKVGADIVVTVGDHAQLIAQAAELAGTTTHHLDSNQAAVAFLADLLVSGDTVLFKASRGARFEEISQGTKLAITG
ncbi:MAG: UDP-N-acetylmuramoyl-tripeptide--D-alanyl-D-alanine ligase [Propionibacteriaceae bacterium]|jgi:UDP-N-acetylmuramoyl-tripeptide--D-alanyl-D-alanine ligase|nr:UDP-N-acetylmuramoyl-tripeptide--D-alanyl-D-alanine ligase [Propionibacteriaceae bacterium]